MKQLLFIITTIFIFQNCQPTATQKQPESKPIALPKKPVVSPEKDTTTASMPMPKDTVEIKPLPVAPRKVEEKSAQQPKSATTFDAKKWTEVIDLDPTIALDLRYATTNNFMEEKVYECGRCFLRPAVAKAIVQAHQELQKQGLGLKMFDCYRPRPIQWKLWNKVPNPKYVADPRKGSMHNRGSAIDLTIVDENGTELNMGTPYDYFGKEGWTFYENLPEEVLKNRKLLRETLGKHGLKHIKTEWWHFTFRSQKYSISDDVWPCE